MQCVECWRKPVHGLAVCYADCRRRISDCFGAPIAESLKQVVLRTPGSSSFGKEWSASLLSRLFLIILGRITMRGLLRRPRHYRLPVLSAQPSDMTHAVQR